MRKIFIVTGEGVDLPLAPPLGAEREIDIFKSSQGESR